MLADIDWANVHVAGAFIIGAILGGVVVLRVFKYVIEYLRRDRRE